MVPTKIVESSAEQQTMGLLARFMSTTMQKLTGIAYEHDCTVGFINQIREKSVDSALLVHQQQLLVVVHYHSMLLNVSK